MAYDGLCQSEILDHVIALGNAEGIVAQEDLAGETSHLKVFSERIVLS